MFYCSPSGAALRNLVQIKEYLLSAGTCKCGLPCPLRPDYFFEFNSQVSEFEINLFLFLFNCEFMEFIENYFSNWKWCHYCTIIYGLLIIKTKICQTLAIHMITLCIKYLKACVSIHHHKPLNMLLALTHTLAIYHLYFMSPFITSPFTAY